MLWKFFLSNVAYQWIMTWGHLDRKTTNKWSGHFVHTVCLWEELLIHMGCYYDYIKKISSFALFFKFLWSFTPHAETVALHTGKISFPSWNLKISLCIALLACYLNISLDTEESLFLKAWPADAKHGMEVYLSKECIIIWNMLWMRATHVHSNLWKAPVISDRLSLPEGICPHSSGYNLNM